MQTAKALIRLGGWPGWYEFSLGAQSLCSFCHVAAHICIKMEIGSKGARATVHMYVVYYVSQTLWFSSANFTSWAFPGFCLAITVISSLTNCMSYAFPTIILAPSVNHFSGDLGTKTWSRRHAPVPILFASFPHHRDLPIKILTCAFLCYLGAKDVVA